MNNMSIFPTDTNMTLGPFEIIYYMFFDISYFTETISTLCFRYATAEILNTYTKNCNIYES